MANESSLILGDELCSVRGKCEICSEALGEEIHHLEPQKIASKNGIIKTENGEFHKNHLANLISVCEKCHDKLHKNNTVLKKNKRIQNYRKVIFCLYII